MGASSLHPVELLTGVGATGVEVMLAVVRGETALPAHPMIPVIQVAVAKPNLPQLSLDLDVVVREEDGISEEALAAKWASKLATTVAQCLSRAVPSLPKLFRGPVSDFQLPRAAGAVSM